MVKYSVNSGSSSSEVPCSLNTSGHELSHKPQPRWQIFENSLELNPTSVTGDVLREYRLTAIQVEEKNVFLQYLTAKAGNRAKPFNLRFDRKFDI